MSLRGATFKGIAWLAGGAAASAITRVLIVAVLARLLTPADFGLIAAAVIVVRFSELFSQMGVGPALVQRQELDPGHASAGFLLSVVLASVAAVIVWLAAPAVEHFFGIAGLGSVMRVLVALFPLNGIAVVPVALLERELRFDVLAKIETFSYVVGYGIVGVLLAWHLHTHWALVAATVAQCGFRTALVLGSRRPSLDRCFDRSTYRDISAFTLGFGLTRIASFFALQGDNIVIGRWMGASALGFYSRAYSISSMPTLYLGRILNRVLFPVLSRIQSDSLRVQRAFRQALLLTAVALIPSSLFLCILAPELIELLLGPAWGETVLPFRILVIGSFLRASQKISGAVVLAGGAVFSHSRVQMLYAAAVLTGAYFAFPWGLGAVATAVLGAMGLQFALHLRLAAKATRMSLRQLRSTLSVAFLAGGVVLALILPTAILTRGFLDSPVTILLLEAAIAILAGTLFAFGMRNSVTGAEIRNLAKPLLRSERR